jgi:hypothetical protein
MVGLRAFVCYLVGTGCAMHASRAREKMVKAAVEVQEKFT